MNPAPFATATAAAEGGPAAEALTTTGGAAPVVVTAELVEAWRQQMASLTASYDNAAPRRADDHHGDGASPTAPRLPATSPAGLSSSAGHAPAAEMPSSMAGLVDLLEEVERFKRCAAAVEAVVITRIMDTARRQWQAQRAVEDADAAKHGRSRPPIRWERAEKAATREIGLACRISPWAGVRLVPRAQRLVRDLPVTLAGLAAGQLSEHAAELIDKQTRDLTRDHAGQVDADLAGLHETGADTTLERRAQQLAYALEPWTVSDRARKAPRERRVTCRPAADGMAWLTALLPLSDAVACYASLDRGAATAHCDGDDDRTRSQVMADDLVERVTGHRATHHPRPTGTEARDSHFQDTGSNDPDAADAHDGVTGDGDVYGGRMGGRAAGTTGDPSPGPGQTADVSQNRPDDNGGPVGDHDAGTDAAQSEVADGRPAADDSAYRRGATAGHASGAGTGAGEKATAGHASWTTTGRGGHAETGTDQPSTATHHDSDDTVIGNHDTDDTTTDPPAAATRDGSVPVTACGACGAVATPTSRPSIEVGLIMTDTSLFALPGHPAREAPALLDGRPIPAFLARELITDPDTLVHLRRLYDHPRTGQLVAMDNRARLFTGLLRRFVATRDQYCRGPFCGAPIRDTDHVHTHTTGGPTAGPNGQGTCKLCNLTKDLPGFTTYTVRQGQRTGNDRGTRTGRGAPTPRSAPAGNISIDNPDLDNPALDDTSIDDISLEDAALIDATGPAVAWRTPSGREYITRPPQLIPTLPVQRADMAGSTLEEPDTSRIAGHVAETAPDGESTEPTSA